MNWPINKKGSYALVHDEEIQRHVPAEEWERVVSALDEDRLTRVYATHFGCRDRKHVEALLPSLGFSLPPFERVKDHRNKVAS